MTCLAWIRFEVKQCGHFTTEDTEGHREEGNDKGYCVRINTLPLCPLCPLWCNYYTADGRTLRFTFVSDFAIRVSDFLPMRLDRRLQIVLALLVSVAALMLGLGRREPRLPVLAIVAALVSLYGTDIRGWLRLNRWIANIAAVGCVAYCLSNFFRRGQQEMQLLSIADLLIYLQIILLFQEKNERVYWQVSILSLSQIVVGSALTAALTFALLMGLYVALGLVFLWLLHWYRAEQRANVPRVARPMRPLHAKAAFVAASPVERDASMLPLPGWRTLLGWSLGAWALTAVLFLLLPRGLAQQAAADLGSSPQRTTGFSETVKLGALGETIQNPEIVMRVRFSDPRSGADYSVEGLPLFRGTLLTKYESPGSWSDPGVRDDRVVVFLAKSAPERVMQRIELLPLRENIVFSVYPPVLSGMDEPPNFHTDRLHLYRGPTFNKSSNYELGTLGIYAGRPREIVPLIESATRARAKNLIEIPRDRLPTLVATAARIVAQQNLPPENRLARARAVESYLRDSGRFTYSLTGQERDRDLDPIEDFVRNHPVGHCEYFASALCLMLRSLDIPARLVVGFRCEWNPLSGDYVVRQLHAHAWVEAYLEPEQIPVEALAGWPPGAAEKGGWLILDPTPGSADGTLSSSGLLKWWQDSTDYLQLLWGRYVIGMNAQQQRDSIYGPIAGMAANGWRFVSEEIPGRVAALWGGAADVVRPVVRWGVLALALVAAWAIRRLRPWRILVTRASHAPRSRNGRLSKTGPEVAFFRRWEKLWSRRGLVKAPQQTQREFARRLDTRRFSAAQQQRVRGLSAQLVEAFYRVRFGGRALDKVEAEAVEHALLELETIVSGER